MDLTPQSRDLVIRTILSEAGNQPDDGLAGVAAVIKNRVDSGRFGADPINVVLAKNQFEPWSLPRSDGNHPLKWSEISPQYQRAGTILDGVWSGDISDPTSGATHFYSPVDQSALGRKPPYWAKGQPLAELGGAHGHAFFAPEGRVVQPNAVEAINAAIKAQTPSGSSSAMNFADNAKDGSASAPGDLFKNAGFSVPGAAADANQYSQPAQSGTEAGSLFKSAGFVLPGEKQAQSYVGLDGKPSAFTPEARTAWISAGMGDPDERAAGSQRAMAEANDPNSWRNKSILRQIHETIDPTTIAGDAAGNVVQSTKDAFHAGNALAASGLTDIRSGNYSPKFPSTSPNTWSAGGLVKTGAGALSTVLSPVTGAINALVTDPVTKLTANPDAGEKAGLLAGLLVPGPKGVSTVREALPPGKATNELVRAIGPENVSAAVERLRANPNLSVMDVSDPVRTMAQGLIDPAQPSAQTILTQAAKERAAAAPAAVNAAYTASMGEAPDVVKMVDGLKQRATDAGKNIIQPALESAKPVDVGPVVAAIDKELKPGVQSATPGSNFPPNALQQELAQFKSKLVDDNGSMIVDPIKLHGIQSDLRERAYQLSTSSSGADRLLGRDLYEFRNHLVDAIDQATSGKYKPGLEKFRDAKQIHEAFDAGFDTLKNRAGVAGLEDRPESFNAWMNSATPEEIVARRLGTRADIDQKINGVRFAARRGTDIPEIPYNQEKLRMLFGKDEADRLIRSMNDIRDQALTNSKLLAGSKTAETLAGQKALEIRKVGGGNPLQYFLPTAAEMLVESNLGIPGVGAGSVVALSLGHRALQKVGQVQDRLRNIEIAKAASATGPAREEVINRLLSHPKVVRQLQKSGNALTVPLAP